VVVAEVKALLLWGMTELHQLYIMAQEGKNSRQASRYDDLYCK